MDGQRLCDPHPELVRGAAKEAVKVADLLVVCGFAFDPRAGEEASPASAG